MNTAQRVVLVIALGIGLVAVGYTANVLMLDPVEPGWFAYAPNTGATLSESDTYFIVADDEAILRQAAVWIAVLALWTAGSFRLLRSSPAGHADD